MSTEEEPPVSSTPTVNVGPFAPSDGVTPRIYLDLKTGWVNFDAACVDTIASLPTFDW